MEKMREWRAAMYNERRHQSREQKGQQVQRRSRNCFRTFFRRKKKSHQMLTGRSMKTKEMARSCLKDSVSLTKRSGMAKVSKGRKAMAERQKARATAAQTSAALRDQGRKRNRPMPVVKPKTIRKRGTTKSAKEAMG